MTPLPTRPATRPPGRSRARRWAIAGGVALIYLLPFVSLDGALEVFLKLGDIQGESMDENHKDEIDILSWSWGGAAAGSTKVGGRPTRPPKNVAELLLTKRTDRSTAGILANLFSGKFIPEATLTVAQSGGSSEPLEILKMDFKDVLVTSYDTDSDAGTALPLEKVGLGFDYISATYILFDADGKSDGGAEVFWTVSTNTGGGSSTGGGGGGPPPNTAPTITDIADQAVDEDGSKTVTFTVSDSETPAGSLTLGRSSSNTTLLPLSNIVFGGSGSSRNATLTPAPNQSGTTSVVITVSDGSRTDSTSFTLTVNPVNDPPSLELLGAQTTEADVPLDVDVTVVDIDSPLVTLAGTANPPALVASIDDLTTTGNIRTVRMVPAPGATGTTTITLTATDDALPVAGQTQTSFPLTINPAVGSGPTAILVNGLDSSIPVAVDENAPNGTELGLLDAVDDPGIEHEFTLLDDAGGRFAIGGAGNQSLVVADGTLLNFEANGSHAVVIKAADLADPLRSRADPFTVEIRNVNEPPAITLPVSFGPTPPDTLFSLDGIAVADPDSTTADIVATFGVTDGVLQFDESGTFAGTTTNNGTTNVTVTATVGDLSAVLATSGGLTYRSDPTFLGSDTLTMTTDDQGSSGSGGPQGDAGTAPIDVELTPWEVWRRANFDASQLADLNISGFTADADGDGFPNGGEYGVDGDPNDPLDGPGRIELIYVDVAALSYPAVRFPRRISDPDLTITTEIATDLTGWSSGPAFTFEAGATPIDPDFDQPTIRSLFDVTEGSKQQLRLHFALDSP